MDHYARHLSSMGDWRKPGMVIFGAEVLWVEGRVEQPDGTLLWAMVHIEPIEDAHGQLLGAINCFHDIRDRKSVV